MKPADGDHEPMTMDVDRPFGGWGGCVPVHLGDTPAWRHARQSRADAISSLLDEERHRRGCPDLNWRTLRNEGWRTAICVTAFQPF